MADRRLKIRSMALASAVAIGVASSARAADGTWNSTPTDGAWQTSANWVGGTVPGLNDGSINSPDTAFFNSASTTVLIVPDANRNIRNITFDTAAAAAFTVGTTGGNALNLTSGGTISVTSTVATNQVVNAPLVIQGASYTISNASLANSLTIGGGITGGTAVASTLTLSHTNNPTSPPTANGGGTVSGIIADGAATPMGVTRSGGTLSNWTLSNANTYTGPTLINSGVLTITNASALGGTGQGTQVNNTGSLRLSGGIHLNGENLTLAGNDGTHSPLNSFAGSNTYTGAITLANDASDTRIRSQGATAPLTLNGTIHSLDANNIVFQASGAITVNSVISGVAGAKVIKSSTGTALLTLNGLNTYDGTTTSSSGTIAFNSIGNVNSGTPTALGMPTTATNGIIGLGGSSGLQYTGTANTSTNRGINITGATATITFDQSGSGSLAYTANPTLAAGAKTIAFAGSGTGIAEFAGVIPNAVTDPVAITKSGTSTWTLSGANTYTGGTTLSAGVLNINNAGTGGTSSAIGTGTLTVTASASIDNTSGLPITLSTNNPISLAGGTLTFVGANNLNMGTGAATLTGGNRIVGVTNSTATLTVGGAVGEDAAGRTFTKQGAGTLRIDGNTTYTGTTTVSAGTLLLMGSTSATAGTLSVSSGGTLGGNGTVNALISVASGGTLMGGDGVAATEDLTITAGATLPSGSIVRLALGPSGAHSTLIRTGGAVSFATNQQFSFANAGATTGIYDNIITGLAADPGTTGTWTITNTPGFAGTFSYDGLGNIDLNLSSVPEPATAGLLGLAAVGLLSRRRRR